MIQNIEVILKYQYFKSFYFIDNAREIAKEKLSEDEFGMGYCSLSISLTIVKFFLCDA